MKLEEPYLSIANGSGFLAQFKMELNGQLKSIPCDDSVYCRVCCIINKFMSGRKPAETILNIEESEIYSKETKGPTISLKVVKGNPGNLNNLVVTKIKSCKTNKNTYLEEEYTNRISLLKYTKNSLGKLDRILINRSSVFDDVSVGDEVIVKDELILSDSE